VYDPSGTMEGGSLPSGPSFLAQLQQLNDMLAQRDTKAAELQALSAALAELQASEAKAQQATKQLDILQIELKSLQARQQSSEHYTLSESVKASRAEADTLRETLASSDARKAELRARITELEGFIRDFESARAEKGAALEKRLAALAKEQAAAAKAQAEQARKSSMLSIAVSELAKEHAALETSIGKLESESIAALEQSVSTAQTDVESKRAVFDAFSTALAAEKAKHSALDKAGAKLAKEIAQLSKAVTDAQLEAKKGTGALARAQSDKTDAHKALVRLEKEFDWLAAEKHLFGVAGGEYDFASAEGSAHSKAQLERLSELQAEQDALSRRINKKVMGMFERAESEAAELNSKRAIILEDKAQIETVMRELDVEKTRTLTATWKCVSDSFGTIFSTLLPGVTAKLVLADGATSVMDGLDIRVAFGGVEKESLSELSGGQRSLLALSLILALLKYKPAPMYILDEIDAALDLSHTQNIGHVLKTHFGEAQFIVVSLKEGMFNNANVLFRTKFVEGVSTVIRTTSADRKKIKA